MKTAIEQLFGNVRNVFNQWPWKEITVEDFGLGRAKRGEVMMGMSRTLNNTRTVPSVIKLLYQCLRGGLERTWRSCFDLSTSATLNTF